MILQRTVNSILSFFPGFLYVVSTFLFPWTLCADSLVQWFRNILVNLKYHIHLAISIRLTIMTYLVWMGDNWGCLWHILTRNHQQSWRPHSYPAKQRAKSIRQSSMPCFHNGGIFCFLESDKIFYIFLLKNGYGRNRCSSLFYSLQISQSKFLELLQNDVCL